MLRQILLATLILITLPSFADEEESPNNCGKLVVSITNGTNTMCRLESQVLNHGYYSYTSHVPAFIPANHTAEPFYLTQSWWGPDLTLTYRCGNEGYVTFRSKQNVCWLMAGSVYGEISKISQSNLQTSYTAQPGSSLWNQHGSIHWAIY